MTAAQPLKRQHHVARVFTDFSRRRIGILGGSFNPAHEGHAHIADMAVQQLQLDQLWWLVSPQNPLKSDREMAGFDKRYQVTDLEVKLGLRHTALTLNVIKTRMRHCQMVWVMGADNLIQFHKWHKPKSIAKTMAIAVVNRPGSVAAALSSPGAKIAGRKLPPRRMIARRLPQQSWVFLRGAMNSQSASAIRAQQPLT